MTLIAVSSSLLLAAVAPTASASTQSGAKSKPTAVVGQRAGTTADASSDAFVTRSGSHLLLNGRPWRFSGVNMYWLGLDDNVQDANGPEYPTHARIDDGFAGAAALGARLVRSHTLGISVGSPRSLEPSLGQFNDAAFDTIDYSVFKARQSGIRLMIPLTDQWHYYHGGKHTFVAWRGHPDLPGQNAATSNTQKVTEELFYTDPTIISDFHDYIAHLLDHVNPYTGMRLGSDPTIAIWETGNELWDAPPAWTEQTAKFIKSQAPQALVADGSAATGMHVSSAAITAPDVDIVGGHFYPTDPNWASSDAQTAAADGKAYVVGEYPLNGADASGWLSGVAGNGNIAGDLAWSLLPHLADGSPEPHGDGYALHVPGATPGETAQVALLAAHMMTIDSTTPVPSGPVNLLHSVGVASAAAGPSAFTAGSTAPSAPSLSVGVALGANRSLRVTVTGHGYVWIYPQSPGDGASVAAGNTYSATVSARLPYGSTSPSVAAAHISWYDASGRYLSGSDGPATPLKAGTWQPLTVTAVAPADAALALPQWQTPSPAASGNVVDIGEFGISAGPSAVPWRSPDN